MACRGPAGAAAAPQAASSKLSAIRVKVTARGKRSNRRLHNPEACLAIPIGDCFAAERLAKTVREWEFFIFLQKIMKVNWIFVATTASGARPVPPGHTGPAPGSPG